MKTPLMFVGYRVMGELKQDLYDEFLASYLEPGEGMDMYYLTKIEQEMFVYLLNLNHKHLSPGFRPPWGAQYKDLKLSFFVPIAKVAQEDTARLNRKTGCVVCGQSTSGICTGCGASQYCGIGKQYKMLTPSVLIFVFFFRRLSTSTLENSQNSLSSIDGS